MSQMRIEDRQLLAVAQGIAGVAEVESDDPVGGSGKQWQQRATDAAAIRASSMRDGAFSRPLMAACEQRSRRSLAPDPRQTWTRVRWATSHSVTIPVGAGDCHHAKAQHAGKRVDNLGLIAPVGAAAGRSLGETDVAFRHRSSTGPQSDEIRPPSKEALQIFRRTPGRQNGSGVPSFMAGVAHSLFAQNGAQTANFHHIAPDCATSVTPKSHQT